MTGLDFDMERLHLLSQLTEFRRLVDDVSENEVIMHVSVRARIGAIAQDLARLEAVMAASSPKGSA